MQNNICSGGSCELSGTIGVRPCVATFSPISSLAHPSDLYHVTSRGHGGEKGRGADGCHLPTENQLAIKERPTMGVLHHQRIA